MAFTTYKEKLKALSRQLIEAQKPIRILNSIRPSSAWEEALKKSKFKDIPKDVRSYYESIPLNFDAEKKLSELKDLRSHIFLQLAEGDVLREHLASLCDQYISVVEMLKNRGRPDFYRHSRELYGSPKDCFAEDHNTISAMSQLLYGILTGVHASLPQLEHPESLSAEFVVEELNRRFASYFGEDKVLAKLSDGIVADAAAGGDRVKIREGAMFSQRELDLYEVHEGWVHVGSTLNGRAQRAAEFLSVGPPRCASTQEGLAVLMEIFTFRTYVQRAQAINDRILCIEKVEDGANILDVIEYLRVEGYSESECLTNAFRVFRGGPLQGGAPFTKDISYCKGFVENYNFLRSCIRASKPFLIPYLFVGKLHVDDIPMLYAKHLEGLVDPPQHLPPQFRDLNGLAVWMSFSSFFNRVDLQAVQSHYQKLFERHL